MGLMGIGVFWVFGMFETFGRFVREGRRRS